MEACGCGTHGKDETQGRSHARKGDFGTEVSAIERICLLLTDVEDCSEFKTSLGKIVSFRAALGCKLRLFFPTKLKDEKVTKFGDRAGSDAGIRS